MYDKISWLILNNILDQVAQLAQVLTNILTKLSLIKLKRGTQFLYYNYLLIKKKSIITSY